jgi:hypothetical protein
VSKYKAKDIAACFFSFAQGPLDLGAWGSEWLDCVVVVPVVVGITA